MVFSLLSSLLVISGNVATFSDISYGFSVSWPASCSIKTGGLLRSIAAAANGVTRRSEGDDINASSPAWYVLSPHTEVGRPEGLSAAVDFLLGFVLFDGFSEGSRSSSAFLFLLLLIEGWVEGPFVFFKVFNADAGCLRPPRLLASVFLFIPDEQSRSLSFGR
jgi:hypothetical protein